MAIDLEHREGAQRIQSAIFAAENNLRGFKQSMKSIAAFKALPAAERADILDALGVAEADVLSRIAPLETLLPTIQSMTFKARYSF